MKTILLILILILCVICLNAQNTIPSQNKTITKNNNNNIKSNDNNSTSVINYEILPFIRNYSIVDSYKFPEVILYGTFSYSNKPILIIDAIKHYDYKILDIRNDTITQIGFIHPHRHSSNFSIEYETNGMKSNIINVQVQSKIYEHYTDQLTNELVLEGIFIYENKSIIPEITIGSDSMLLKDNNNNNLTCTITKSNYYTIRCLLPFKYGCKNGIKISNVYDYNNEYTNIQVCSVKPKIEKIIATVNEWEKEFIVTVIGDRIGKGAWLNLKVGSSQLLDGNNNNKVIEYIYNNGSNTYECIKILSSNDAYISCKFPYDAYKDIKKNHKSDYNYVSIQQTGTYYLNKQQQQQQQQINYDMIQLSILEYDNIILIFNGYYGRLIPLIVIPVLIFLIISFIVLIITVIVLKKKYDSMKCEINHKKSYKDPFADPFS